MRSSGVSVGAASANGKPGTSSLCPHLRFRRISAGANDVPLAEGDGLPEFGIESNVGAVWFASSIVAQVFWTFQPPPPLVCLLPSAPIRKHKTSSR